LTNGDAEVRDVVDLLRRFYSTYGVADEGPSEGFDAGVLPANLIVPVQDINDLHAVLDDLEVRRQFGVCREILDDLTSRLTSEELLRELTTSPAARFDDFDDLANGVFWFSLAASLDQRRNGLPRTPFDAAMDLPLPVRVRITMVGSLVLRLYLALVYMREGPLSSLIAQGAAARKPCCGRIRKLLNADYVRRIRNALSHGTFSMSIAGIAFRDDEGGVIVATPGFLKWLCEWLMIIQLQALAARSRAEELQDELPPQLDVRP
jgi:hypothetical protein